MKKFYTLAPIVWLTLNILTLTAYPGVWVDEILSADAGIHLAQGKGFVSAAWFNQPSWEFWASYPPLYSSTLAGWLKLFGISEVAVRSFSLVLVTASLVMIGLLLKRIESGALKPPVFAILAALACSEPLIFLSRAGRPDSLSVFLLSLTALVFVSRGSPWRNAALFAMVAVCHG